MSKGNLVITTFKFHWSTKDIIGKFEQLHAYTIFTKCINNSHSPVNSTKSIMKMC